MRMHNRREDSGCCSRIFLKSIMVVFNIFFWLSGIAFLLIGLGSLFMRHGYISLLNNQLFPITTYIFIGTGGLILLMGCVGCIGTVREVRCCLIFFSFVLMAVFLLETCVGVLAYMYESAIHEELARNLNKTISEKYSVDNDVTIAVDNMQSQFHCCGATSSSDWEFSKWSMQRNDTRVFPTTCCSLTNATCTLAGVYTEGCVDHLEKYVRFHLILIGGVGLGLSILQLFGIIFSCCLAQKIKEEINL
ncbi:CD151 antigen-like [Physella acuta]|uniref:CD151 antigen-like n=1 Tax=Physella acuta TaxID=109671 RepID=UPI0027DE71AB|nr:CD151 antigen-like [Physella acuta]XP_059161978.1 CD151 antigen-like [Physella acuta]XP_059161979.1 CD151 antigen-like [Physella acuta]XP_059161980.1 CD151 antigen-like [Physella acuta]XP_059161981.1 CD151 antigen-like [Physella acuta]XP_059161982.1 CD151 antigen-like [Physella acuta]XP_059161983.1 CD151 antigen-like [Physella acuta]XP_059161984.1 CD151 antigen-like [Physella acuta]